MRIKTFIETYLLTNEIAKNNKKNKENLINGNEIDENYFRCDDEKGDGRGEF